MTKDEAVERVIAEMKDASSTILSWNDLDSPLDIKSAKEALQFISQTLDEWATALDAMQPKSAGHSIADALDGCRDASGFWTLEFEVIMDVLSDASCTPDETIDGLRSLPTPPQETDDE